jgi:hypothetical protein
MAGYSHLSASLWLVLTLVLAACGRDAVLAVEPCTPLTDLVARTHKLDEGNFITDALGERRTHEMRWKQLIVTDGPKPLFTLPDVRAWLSVYQDRISEVCTRRIFGGAVAELPVTVGQLRDAFLSSGFVVDHASGGDLLSTTSGELLRQENYIRGDYLAVVAVDIVNGGDAFMFDVCIMSNGSCRSPALLDLKRGRRQLGD